jgi:hypothetical protein
VIHDGKIVVQNEEDGGANRGIHFWSVDDSDFGAYVASASGGVSLGGSGNPVQGYTDGSNAMNDLCLRLRVSDDPTRGIVFENSSESRLMSLRGSDGLLSVSGDIICEGRIVVQDGPSLLGGDVIHDGKIVVQNEEDGGANRGIHFWSVDDSDFGAYVASASGGVSLGGSGSPVQGYTDGSNAMNDLCLRLRVSDDPARGIVFENSSESRLMSLRGSDGLLSVSGDIICGGRIVVHDGQDGGTDRGIFLWDNSNSSRGIYMAAENSTSLSGDVAVGGNGFSGISTRVRIDDSANNGIIFENDSEILLMSVRGNDGRTQFSGDVIHNGRIVVQDGQDGGEGRGIHLWTGEDTNRGIYAASAGASRSLSGSNAVEGDGFSGTSTRLRIDADSDNGIIFENSAEELLFSVRGDDGFSHFTGDVDVRRSLTASNLISQDGSAISNLNMDNAASGVLDVLRGGTGTQFHGESKILIGNGTAGIVSASNLYWNDVEARLGIGTSNPEVELHVVGDMYSCNIQMTTDGTPGTPVYSWVDDCNMGMFRADSNVIGFSTEGRERLRISDNGNVGIGTFNPNSLLDVDGEIRANIVKTTRDGSATDPAFSWAFDSNMGMYRAESDVIAFSTAGVERLRIDDLGHVGIGVSNIEANSALHVDGDIRIRNSDLVGACNIYTKTEVDDLIDDVDDNLAEGLYWDSETQRLGISTVVPDAKLHVIGDTITSALRLSEDGTAVDPAVTWVADADSGMYRVEENALGFSTGGVERMRVAANGYVGVNASNPSEMLYVDGNIYATGEMTSASDRRLKTNLRSLESENCLAKLRQMSGYRFNRTDWNRLGGGAQKDTDFIGFVAQDVLQVMPELVKHDDKNDRYSVNYAHMAVVLTEAIKTLAKDKEALQNDVSELKRDVAELRRNAT